MTNRDAAVLGFRLMGVWLIAGAAIGIAGLPYFWDPQWENVRAFGVFATVLPALVSIAIGVPLWFSAEWFAANTFPSPPTDGMAAGRLRGEPVFALALSIIGALFVCEALPVILQGVALFVASRRVVPTVLGPDLDRQRMLWDAAAKASLTAALGRLLIGAGLLAGPARVAAIVRRMRREWSGELEE